MSETTPLTAREKLHKAWRSWRRDYAPHFRNYSLLVPLPVVIGYFIGMAIAPTVPVVLAAVGLSVAAHAGHRAYKFRQQMAADRPSSRMLVDYDPGSHFTAYKLSGDPEKTRVLRNTKEIIDGVVSGNSPDAANRKLAPYLKDAAEAAAAITARGAYPDTPPLGEIKLRKNFGDANLKIKSEVTFKTKPAAVPQPKAA